MKQTILILLVLLILSVAGCDQQESYDDRSQRELNALKPPVVLIGKAISLGSYSISVRDSTGYVLFIGNMSGIANTIGESRNIGDTIIYKP